MEIKLLSCPLCLKPHFDGVDTLRVALIAVATSQISCPVCNEVLLGLDKLTIHLFSHVANSLAQIQTMDLDKTDINRNIQREAKIQTETVLNDSIVKQMQNETIINESIVKHMQNETILKQVQCQNELNNLRIVNIPEQTTTKQLPQETMESQNQIDLIVTNKQNNIRCDICNFCFSDENILEMHQKLLHQTLSDKNTGIYSYHCHLCSKKFKMRGSLMVHLRVAHYGFSNDKQLDEKVKGTKALPKTVDGKIAESESKNAMKQWTCDVCSKLFTTKYFLKKHKRLHTGEMPYFCSQCNKSFTFQQSYHKHMLYHSSDKPHVCGECGRAFKELSTLHNHERIHSGERPFVCETCGKCFRQRVSYLVHRRIHTGVMPYQCTACHKTFRYKVSQRSHKCPTSPPGSVVRTTNSESLPSPTTLNSNSNDELVIRNIIDDGTSVAQSTMVVDDGNGIVSGALNTIVFNVQGEIIGQNFAFDGKNIITFNGNIDDNKILENTSINGAKEYFHQGTSLDNNNTSDMPMSYSNESENPDFFTMVMSPSLPDVQGLCLVNSPEENKVNKNALHTINEESLKELLYGQHNPHL